MLNNMITTVIMIIMIQRPIHVPPLHDE